MWEKPTLSASEDAYQEEHRCLLMKPMHPSSLGFLLEKTLLGSFGTNGTQMGHTAFLILFVLLSEVFCVFLFLKRYSGLNV